MLCLNSSSRALGFAYARLASISCVIRRVVRRIADSRTCLPLGVLLFAIYTVLRIKAYISKLAIYRSRGMHLKYLKKMARTRNRTSTHKPKALCVWGRNIAPPFPVESLSGGANSRISIQHFVLIPYIPLNDSIRDLVAIPYTLCVICNARHTHEPSAEKALTTQSSEGFLYIVLRFFVFTRYQTMHTARLIACKDSKPAFSIEYIACPFWSASSVVTTISHSPFSC